MPHTIVLADDSKTIRQAVATAFAREPFDLIAVPSADEAIAKAKEVQPSAVLADHFMPGKTGYEVAEALKADPSTANIPVLLLSGTAAPFDEARCQSSGAVGHLPKPFDCQGLIDKVSELVGGVSDEERAAAAASSTAPAGPSAAASLPAPPRGLVPGARPSTQQMAGIGVTSAPMGTASPLAGDDASISIDLGAGDTAPAAQPTPAAQPAPAAQAAPAAQPAPAQPAPAQPGPAQPAPAAQATPAASVASAVTAQVASAASSAVSAAGVPATDAVNAATREIIERVVWEVVPELAETLIREEIKRLLAERA